MKKLYLSTKRNEKALFSKEQIKKDELILNIEGYTTKLPSKYSIQVTKNSHIDLPADLESVSENYYWAFLNHSCQPNAWIQNKQLYALENIDPDTEITFNYNTTEYKMNSPFICMCNSKNCHRLIKGFKYLSAEQKREIEAYCSEYLMH